MTSISTPSRHSKTLALAGLYWLARFAASATLMNHRMQRNAHPTVQARYDLGTVCVTCGMVKPGPPWPRGWINCTSTYSVIECAECAQSKRKKAGSK